MYWKYASILMFGIFCFWVWIEVKLKSNKEDRKEEAFWARERKANSVRRKPIDHLDYIYLPKDLPYDLHTDNDEIAACLKVIDELKEEKILNLTGYSNTDLKLKYGAPNITELSQADQYYTTLVTTLQKWADELIKLNCRDEALKIMEFSLSTGADIGKTFRLVAKHYLETGNKEAFKDLIKKAENLKSLNSKSIVRSLKEME